MINYIIHTSVIWFILFAFYKIFLSSEKHFAWNRTYLIGSLAVGLLLPLLQYVSFDSEPVFATEFSEVYHEQIEYVGSFYQTTVQNTESNNTVGFVDVLYLFYLLGMSIVMIRLSIAIRKLYRLYKFGHKKRHLHYTEVQTQGSHLPFSIFRFIFFSGFQWNKLDKMKILRHELHHVYAGHSWDILFVEILKIFFWWNPLIYLFKNEISIIHEYSADQAAIIQASKKEYCSLLLQTNFPNVDLQLGQPFFQSFIKKRIDMIYRKKSSNLSLLKFSLPFVALVFMAFLMVDQTETEIKEIQNQEQSGKEKKAIRADELLIKKTGEIHNNGHEHNLSQLEDYVKGQVDSQIIATDDIQDEQIADKNEIKIAADGAYYFNEIMVCLLYTSPSPRDQRGSRMPSSA